MTRTNGGAPHQRPGHTKTFVCPGIHNGGATVLMRATTAQELAVYEKDNRKRPSAITKGPARDSND
jgi:hypothetical protein